MDKIGYLIASVLFIFGLKLMARPRTAVRGNLVGMLGMAVAIGVTLLLLPRSANWTLVFVCLAIGSIVGWLLAVRVPMTAMPQLVGLLNGFGGLSSVLVAAGETLRFEPHPTTDVLVATALSGLIGGVTFWGSLVACGKLQEWKSFDKPWIIKGGQWTNGAMGILLLLASWWMIQSPSLGVYLVVVILSSILGVSLVGPIGGADMPVVIALLNSYSGMAATATGFVINNSVLIIAGSLVGASGIILTQIMCKAMNRSLTNVLFGIMDNSSVSKQGDEVYAKVRSTSPDDIAMILESAHRVVIVPGYGLAVAQAQHAVRDLANVLQQRGIEVEFAIHPVAGRMPGHMNVLLAEADIPYEKLKEMDQINPTMDTVDVAIVIGANDVVNPLARTDPRSPIAGMPILNVDKARSVIVIKRSLSPGFAKIPNPLFAAENALMFFADGKQGVLDIVAALKAG